MSACTTEKKAAELKPRLLVGVIVGVAVLVGVGVRVAVGVRVGVAVNVGNGVKKGVGVGVTHGVCPGTGVAVGSVGGSPKHTGAACVRAADRSSKPPVIREDAR